MEKRQVEIKGTYANAGIFGKSLFVNDCKLNLDSELCYTLASKNQEGENMLELIYSKKWDDNTYWPELEKVGKFIEERKMPDIRGRSLSDYVEVSAGTTKHPSEDREVSVVRLIAKPESDIKFVA